MRTDQHVPGNNVEAAQDRLILVLNPKIFSVSVKWHLAAIHLYLKMIPRHVAQTGKTQRILNSLSWTTVPEMWRVSHLIPHCHCYFNRMSRSHAVFSISRRSSKYGKRGKLVLACVASVPVRKKSSQTIFRKQAAWKLGREIACKKTPYFWKTPTFLDTRWLTSY